MSVAMPMPVSCTVNTSSTLPVADAGAWFRSTVISPCSVNLIALDTRLVSTWRRRSGSASTVAGRPVASRKLSSRPFSCARGASNSSVSSTTLRSENSDGASSSLPASILAKSSTSLMISSRLSPER